MNMLLDEFRKRFPSLESLEQQSHQEEVQLVFNQAISGLLSYNEYTDLVDLLSNKDLILIKVIDSKAVSFVLFNSREWDVLVVAASFFEPVYPDFVAQSIINYENLQHYPPSHIITCREDMTVNDPLAIAMKSVLFHSPY